MITTIAIITLAASTLICAVKWAIARFDASTQRYIAEILHEDAAVRETEVKRLAADNRRLEQLWQAEHNRVAEMMDRAGKGVAA